MDIDTGCCCDENETRDRRSASGSLCCGWCDEVGRIFCRWPIGLMPVSLTLPEMGPSLILFGIGFLDLDNCVRIFELEIVWYLKLEKRFKMYKYQSLLLISTLSLQIRLLNPQNTYGKSVVATNLVLRIFNVKSRQLKNYEATPKQKCLYFIPKSFPRCYDTIRFQKCKYLGIS